MGEHSTLPFSGLHKGIFDTGLLSARPSAPEGDGDLYYATDTGNLYVGVSNVWVIFGASLDDISDLDYLVRIR
jgi:hypothetical protein